MVGNRKEPRAQPEGDVLGSPGRMSRVNRQPTASTSVRIGMAKAEERRKARSSGTLDRAVRRAEAGAIPHREQRRRRRYRRRLLEADVRALLPAR